MVAKYQLNTTETDKNIKVRNGLIELFRFFLIFTVIWQHSLNDLISQQNTVWFPIGVTGFFFISGFYSIKSEKSRFWRFFVTTILYTIIGFLVYLIMFICDVNNYNPLNMFTDGSFLTDYASSWYFLYVMLVITLIAPYLNMLVKKIPKYTSLALIIVIWLCVVFWQQHNGDILGDRSWDIFHYINPYWIAHASSIYLIAGWCGWFLLDSFNKRERWLKIIIFILVLAIYFILNIYDKSIKTWASGKVNLSLLDVKNEISVIPLLFCGSTVLFLNSINIHEKINKFLSYVGKIILPMYLFNGVAYNLILLIGWNTDNYQAYYIFAVMFSSLILLGSTIFWPIDHLTNKIYKHFLSKQKKVY